MPSLAALAWPSNITGRRAFLQLPTCEKCPIGGHFLHIGRAEICAGELLVETAH
jgi:hypothetical protein